jgi:hypothetical protein
MGMIVPTLDILRSMRSTLSILFLLLACGSTLAAPTTAPANLPESVLLFSSFRGNGDDGLHLAWSTDGFSWAALKDDQSFLKPEVGSQKLMRDPCILPGPDGEFRMVWTTGWKGQDIGYAHSKDLIHWQDQKAIPVMRDEPSAGNCWAPEIVYDAAKQQYIIFWATTIPGRFPATDDAGDNHLNHRIYCTKTNDFVSFSKAEIFFDPGFEVIDATMLQDGGKCYLIFKDETLHPEPHKYLRIAASDSIEGPFKIITDPITPSWREGPTAIKLGDWYTIYFDMYRDHRYGVVRSKDLKAWEDATEKLSLPQGMRHGTVFRVRREIAAGLMQ